MTEMMPCPMRTAPPPPLDVRVIIFIFIITVVIVFVDSLVIAPILQVWVLSPTVVSPPPLYFMIDLARQLANSSS